MRATPSVGWKTLKIALCAPAALPAHRGARPQSGMRPRTREKQPKFTMTDKISASTQPAPQLTGATERPISTISGPGVNPRRHTEKQLDEIAAAIRRWGFTAPILIDEAGVLIAGHARLEGARRAGLTSVPAITARGWSEIRKREYLIFDNRIAELAQWNAPELQVALKDIVAAGGDFAGTGMTEKLIKRPPAPVPTASDAAPPRGAVIKCGRHRLMVGDSTAAGEVGTLFDGEAPDLMVTDPPYGIEYDQAWRANAKAFVTNRKERGKVMNDDRHDWHDAYDLFPGRAAYVWRGATDSHLFSMRNFDIAAEIIWMKRIAISRGWYHWAHENCYYLRRRGTKEIWHGARNESAIWEIPRPNNPHNHPTCKPVECMARPIRCSAPPGGIVYDPFIGVGATLLAAEIEGRTCLGIDIEPRHIETSISRWEQHTGGKAEW